MRKHVSSPLVEGKYVHWDKLRRYSPPSEVMSHEDWWLGLRFERELAQKELPFVDKQGRAFAYTDLNDIQRRLHELDLNAAGTIEMPPEIMNEQTRDRYYVSSLIEEAITSSQLEGAHTTRVQAKEMLRSGRSPRDRSERMVLNNFLTMKLINELKAEPLTKDLLFEIHRCVTEGTLDEPDAAGRFRRPEERVYVAGDRDDVFHFPPPAEELDVRLNALCAFANGETPDTKFVHPVIRAVTLHFALAYDHPFIDGNGRAARALFYWAMLHHGYWLFEFVSISRMILKSPNAYYRAFLYTETDNGDLTYFILHQLEVIERAVTELRAYLKRKTLEVQRLERRLRGAIELNHRQAALVSHALRHPQQLYTIESHQRSHGVVYQTARMDMLDLHRRGLLEMHKRGRQMRFSPAPGLEDKLAGQG